MLQQCYITAPFHWDNKECILKGIHILLDFKRLLQQCENQHPTHSAGLTLGTLRRLCTDQYQGKKMWLKFTM